MIIQLLKEAVKDTAFRLSKPKEIEIQGFKLFINTKEPSFSMRRTLRYYAETKAHEPSTTSVFRSIIKEGDMVVDIGANIGYFSLLAASLGARVYAFEPDKKNMAYLLKNAKLNGYGIIASPKAISNKNEATKLYICSYDSGHHTINQNKGIKDYRRTSALRKCLNLFSQKKVLVDTIRLDDFIREKVDIIKMDCEGAEALAFEGMDGILKENLSIKLIVEFFPLLLESMGSSPKDFINKILGYGFRIGVIPYDYDSGKAKIVKSYEELMEICKGRGSHINLILKRDVIQQ